MHVDRGQQSFYSMAASEDTCPLRFPLSTVVIPFPMFTCRTGSSSFAYLSITCIPAPTRQIMFKTAQAFLFGKKESPPSGWQALSGYTGYRQYDTFAYDIGCFEKCLVIMMIMLSYRDDTH